MKKLFVGQRVRILKSDGWPELAGEQGIIVSTCPVTGITGRSEWNVAPDCWGTPIAPYQGVNGGGVFSPSSENIEPILYDGAHPIAESFEEMMGKLREGVVA